VNFYSLLGELDKVNFDKNLVIPILKSIKQHVGELNGTIAIIDYFVSIRNTTFLFDDEMKSCFDKEHFQYNQIFRQYLENYDKFKNVGVKDDIDKYDKARDMLANNNILPFLKSYNFDKIIYKINTEINRAESIDSAFIDNLL
jgi:hypothetical protein